MKKLKTIALTLVALTSMELLLKASDEEPPTLTVKSPAVSDKVIMHSSDKLDVKASGGKTKPPTGGCPPWTASAMKFQFDYSVLVGTPESGTESTSDTLKYDRDKMGKAPTKVRGVQEWTDSTAPTPLKQTVYSPYSNVKNVKVQKPTTITFISGTAATSGANFKFSIKDQDGDLIKSQKLKLLEHVTGATIKYYSLINGDLVYTAGPIDRPDGAIATSGPTSSTGQLVDNVYNSTGGSIARANQAGFISKLHINSHKYKETQGEDDVKYSMNTIDQVQDIHEKFTYHSATDTATSETIYVHTN